MSEITLNSLPKTLDELKAMPQAALTVPEEVAALTVAALALYALSWRLSVAWYGKAEQ